MWVKDLIDLHYFKHLFPEAITFYYFLPFLLFYSSKVNLLIIYFALRKTQQSGKL